MLGSSLVAMGQIYSIVYHSHLVNESVMMISAPTVVESTSWPLAFVLHLSFFTRYGSLARFREGFGVLLAPAPFLRCLGRFGTHEPL